MILDGVYLYKGKKVGIYLECYTFVASSSNQGDSKPSIVRVRKRNCVNANNPPKRTNTKNAVKQGNAGERPDVAARYTVKSSGEIRCSLPCYLADKLREYV